MHEHHICGIKILAATLANVIFLNKKSLRKTKDSLRFLTPNNMGISSSILEEDKGIFPYKH